MDLYTQANQPVFPRAETQSEFWIIDGACKSLEVKTKMPGMESSVLCYALLYMDVGCI